MTDNVLPSYFVPFLVGLVLPVAVTELLIRAYPAMIADGNDAGAGFVAWWVTLPGRVIEAIRP